MTQRVPPLALPSKKSRTMGAVMLSGREVSGSVRLVAIPTPANSARSPATSRNSALVAATSLPPIFRAESCRAPAPVPGELDYEFVPVNDDASVAIDFFENSSLAHVLVNDATGFHSVTTVDEEASARMLKVMFQLNVTRNSRIMVRLKQLDMTTLERRVTVEMGHKRQLHRDEFCLLLGKLLKDDHLNRRDCLTLFSIFDDDKSGVVDAEEFVTGFISLVSSGNNDIAFRFIATLLEGREKSTVNAFISRFELQMIVHAAIQYFKGDRDVCRILEGVPNMFNFSHHLGRIPVVALREAILKDENLFTIFSSLPNIQGTAKIAAESAAARSPVAAAAGSYKAPATGGLLSNADVYSPLFAADQFMVPMAQSADLQGGAAEHDLPQWWSQGGVIYRCTASQPYPQPVFSKAA